MHDFAICSYLSHTVGQPVSKLNLASSLRCRITVLDISSRCFSVNAPTAEALKLEPKAADVGLEGKDEISC